ncbi:6,7-dimethyl-8-ribityllumazine synthase [Weissella paramesenteroides]|uniref:6,7-dimethyl-8-ribityllumazine synthase n=1 Tax=Weissella paramesenteroides TaxID=1249 RepID=UPI002E7BE34A|nr:6,7-dimethyl-8-ribityllumazine synthase [Weissella paramesenteroides]WPQ68541.1 6,7-dimethyl-8-ribityllumazine synthase [Weissella paramesenteroides]
MIYRGNLTQNENRTIAIIASRFNTLIVEQLIIGAKESLKMQGIIEENIDIIWVPGAFEIPLVAKKVSENKKYDGIITLGAVIKGETDHYDLVINASANGISEIGIHTNTPIVFGVLATDTLEQAQQRSGGKSGNKGSEVALALLEVISVLHKLEN